MPNFSYILTIYKETFRANIYTLSHFRMIGLIDVLIAFPHGQEVVTLPFYRSSGTNNHKIKGLWYPIVGIKTISGPFLEFSPLINTILTHTTRHGEADAGWLAKSLFFSFPPNDAHIDGFADEPYYDALLEIGETLKNLYNEGQFTLIPNMDASMLNSILASPNIYSGNTKSQRDNFDTLINEIYHSLPFPS